VGKPTLQQQIKEVICIHCDYHKSGECNSSKPRILVCIRALRDEYAKARYEALKQKEVKEVEECL